MEQFYKIENCTHCSGDGSYPPDGIKGLRICLHCVNGKVFVPADSGEILYRQEVTAGGDVIYTEATNEQD